MFFVVICVDAARPPHRLRLHFVISLANRLSITAGHIQRNLIGFVWDITPLLLVTVFVSYKGNAGPNGDVICRYAIFVGEQSCSEKQD